MNEAYLTGADSAERCTHHLGAVREHQLLMAAVELQPSNDNVPALDEPRVRNCLLSNTHVFPACW